MSSEEHIQQASELPKLTYREKRRLDQAELRSLFPNRKRRGPTRGLKYASKRARNPEEKITVTFMDSVRRVVGDKAAEFISDCSNWVEEFCPLNTVNWAQMNPDKKKLLYSKIFGKYNLPETVDDKPVVDSLSFQCSTLYRHWRFRLKERYFRGKTLAQAKDSRPLTVDKEEWDWLVFEYWGSDKQKERSKTNTTNKLKQSDIPANGSRSTARIFYDMPKSVHNSIVPPRTTSSITMAATIHQ
ncbi:uncharacterized protein LOC141590314 [Silene latifolia]|uniref:uncharacterized protein LOC141590314 n=1 Tax=Silene latifolia TaxID=37657 RepID=UPI003D76C452